MVTTGVQMSVQVVSLEDVVVSLPRPGAAVVECTGEHDLTSSDELGGLVSKLVLENDLLVIDVTEAKFIDSSFLHLLVKADRLCRERGSTFRVQHSTAPVVAKALGVSGVLAFLSSAATREQALR
jgi:anti-anti-sigma factor